MGINYKNIGKRIRDERKIKNMSQEMLAEAASLSPVHISHIETANTKLSLPALVSICNALNVTPNVILRDSITASAPTYKNEFLKIINECQKDELILITDTIQVLLQSYEKAKEIYEKEKSKYN